MSDSFTVPGRFNGPLQSGHGGYAAGALAAFLEQPAEISLRSPVPLETPLDLVEDGDGQVRVLHGETLVLEGRPDPGFEIEVPAAPSLEEARAATAGYRGLEEGEFSCCFVCGRGREDALEVFAGPLDGRDLVASPWTPPDWTAGEDGRVLPAIVWSVLDCPTYFATHIEGDLTPGFLARLTARVDALPTAGAEHVVIGWPIEVDGRKHHAGSAVFTAGGELLAAARALTIEPRAA